MGVVSTPAAGDAHGGAAGVVEGSSSSSSTTQVARVANGAHGVHGAHGTHGAHGAHGAHGTHSAHGALGATPAQQAEEVEEALAQHVVLLHSQGFTVDEARMVELAQGSEFAALQKVPRDAAGCAAWAAALILAFPELAAALRRAAFSTTPEWYRQENLEWWHASLTSFAVRHELAEEGPGQPQWLDPSRVLLVTRVACQLGKEAASQRRFSLLVGCSGQGELVCSALVLGRDGAAELSPEDRAGAERAARGLSPSVPDTAGGLMARELILDSSSDGQLCADNAASVLLAMVAQAYPAACDERGKRVLLLADWLPGAMTPELVRSLRERGVHLFGWLPECPIADHYLWGGLHAALARLSTRQTRAGAPLSLHTQITEAVAKLHKCVDPVAVGVGLDQLGIVPLNASNLVMVAGLASRTEHAEALKKALATLVAAAKRKRTLEKKAASKAGVAMEAAGQAVVAQQAELEPQQAELEPQQAELEPQSIAARLPGAPPQLVGVLQDITLELQRLKRALDHDADADAPPQRKLQRTEGPDAIVWSTHLDVAAEAIAELQDAGAAVTKTAAKTYLDALYSYACTANDRDLMDRTHPDEFAKLAYKDYVAQALKLYRAMGHAR